MSDLRPIGAVVTAPAAVEAGSPPMLQWIEIGLLRVDARYQRDLRADNVRAIARIAETFDWSKFSTVHVAPIEGGLYAIIDGQHRTHAAAACGFDTVPCQVTHMTLRQQASAFAAINGSTTAVTPLQVFRAALAAAEPWAIEIRDTCKAAGCEALTYSKPNGGWKPGEIQSVAFLRKFIARRKPEVATRSLAVFRQAEGVGDTAYFYKSGILRAILEAVASRPHAIAELTRTRRALELFDFEKGEAEASQFVASRRRNGLPSMSQSEVLESLIGTALDKALSNSRGVAA